VANASVLKDSGVWNEEVVEELVQASGVLSELLHNTLDISKLEENKVDFNNNYEAIRSLVTLVMGLTRKSAETKGVKLETRYGASLPPLLEFDKSRLTQVVMNLVTNAIKFTPAQGTVSVVLTWAWNCGQHAGFCDTCPNYPGTSTGSPKSTQDVAPILVPDPNNPEVRRQLSEGQELRKVPRRREKTTLTLRTDLENSPEGVADEASPREKEAPMSPRKISQRVQMYSFLSDLHERSVYGLNKLARIPLHGEAAPHLKTQSHAHQSSDSCSEARSAGVRSAEQLSKVCLSPGKQPPKKTHLSHFSRAVEAPDHSPADRSPPADDGHPKLLPAELPSVPLTAVLKPCLPRKRPSILRMREVPKGFRMSEKRCHLYLEQCQGQKDQEINHNQQQKNKQAPKEKHKSQHQNHNMYQHQQPQSQHQHQLRKLRHNRSAKSLTFIPTRTRCKFLAAKPTEGVLHIDVTDTGCGISAADQEHLFKPFSQANKGVHAKYGGTGLGLWLCSKLVTAMKGSIKCQSEVNKGTTFSIALPLKCKDLNKTNQVPLLTYLPAERAESDEGLVPRLRGPVLHAKS
jgi:chemotaxis protein histidine kinase CheA